MRNAESSPATVDWVAVTDAALPVADALSWAVLPRCGAVVSFLGTVRDHSAGRDGVERLDYECYEEHATRRLEQVAAGARTSWPSLGRVALLHRVGSLGLGDISVVVVVSAPHRDEAFAAARHCIDTLKETVPIWKRETWSGGHDWAVSAHEITEVPDVAP